MTALTPHLITQLLAHPFLRYAVLAGLPVSALSGAVGYLMVLRAQVFTGDALSHVAFTGALTALACGVDPRIGLFVGTIGVGLGLAALGTDPAADDVVIGTVFAWVLGLGVLALSRYAAGPRGTANGAAGVNVLFGSIFGLDRSQAWLAAGIATGLLLALLAIARPLLFASVDEAVAIARGVPVRLLGPAFLALVGAAAAAAAQAIGALLLLGLLAAPAGAAHRLTVRPFAGIALAAGLSSGSLLTGLIVSYLVPGLPPSFVIVAAATGCYAVASL